MANWLITAVALAEKLGVSDRRARQLLKEITPVRKLGTSYEITEADMRVLQKRSTRPGPKKGSKKTRP